MLLAMAMYQSLLATVKAPFTLHWLCMDDETYFKIHRLNLEHVIPYRLGDLENSDPELEAAKHNRPKNYGTAWSQYCWTLTPYFMWWLLRNKLLPDQTLLYVDSDIYFYHSPELIAEACSGKSIGIHRHRHSSYHPSNPVGEFNVGVVLFVNNEVGNACSEQWKSWLLNPDNPYHLKYGTCGDQKYLDLFIPLHDAGNVCVFDREAAIGHAAPWCFDDVVYLGKDQVQEGGAMKPLVFYHFSHFSYNAGDWKDSYKGEWKPAAHKNVRDYYIRYAATLRNIGLILNEQGA